MAVVEVFRKQVRKKVLLLILDSLGGTELLVILVVALVIFGPRKLPQLSRSLGRSLADFKRASQDFKETWEKEARMADEFKDDSISRAMLPPEETGVISETVGRSSSSEPFSSTAGTALAAEGVAATTAATTTPAPAPDVVSASLVPPPSIRPMPTDSSLAQSSSNGGGGDSLPHTNAEGTRKQDWL
ncbi:MAG: sec-independent protein translocase protein TatA [Blastocatellia bacterium]|nr:sec-independent protein translocase protein TatA [Blastocatellia bacterium]